jgi:hypothetical protein
LDYKSFKINGLGADSLGFQEIAKNMDDTIAHLPKSGHVPSVTSPWTFDTDNFIFDHIKKRKPVTSYSK